MEWIEKVDGTSGDISAAAAASIRSSAAELQALVAGIRCYLCTVYKKLKVRLLVAHKVRLLLAKEKCRTSSACPSFVGRKNGTRKLAPGNTAWTLYQLSGSLRFLTFAGGIFTLGSRT